jgi:hypothetical protein
MEGTMSGKLLGIVAAAALLVSVGMANAKDPVKLTDHQLDKVTAGASVTQVPVAASPSTATVTQPITNLGFNLFTIH